MTLQIEQQTEPQNESAAPVTSWWKVEGIQAPRVSSYNPYTREFTGIGTADPSPLERGVWLIPGLAVIGEAPTPQPGHVMVLEQDGRSWVEVVDHRGKTVYSVETQEAVVWGALGDLPDTYTFLEPQGRFTTWDGSAWVEDQALKTAALKENALLKQQHLTQLAKENIGRLTLAVRLEMATVQEVERLKAWEVYLVLLGRLEPMQILPSVSDWPAAPVADAVNLWLASVHFEDLAEQLAAEDTPSTESTESTESTSVQAVAETPGDSGATSTKSTKGAKSTKSTKGSAE
ncbi:tail fiber assembly protein [Pseudomonas parafulva]|uniref:tail fiber assembly protein n=1 Tax=Pseudomonas parafulva TaxID=157782 RepID=UPI000734FD4D|nr:tail fiber assembly protein [Pseudomonas parafulva]